MPSAPMRRHQRHLVGAATLIVLASMLLCSSGCSRKAVSAPAPPSPSNPPTEQGWIIGSIARDLTNLGTFAATPAPWSSLPPDAVDVREIAGEEPGRNYALTIQLPGGTEPVKTSLKIDGSVWSPGLYVPTLRTLFERLKISPPAAGADETQTAEGENLLKVLATPLTADMETQNQRISGWLQQHPLDARAHEQAALLLGTLALRENSGPFWNPRALCNRAAAHLAFARALRPDASECGEVAELLIGLIIDTKTDCQKRIAALQFRVGAHAELGPWVMAAALRNTRDYRLLANPQSATLLERIELFRALSEAISTDEAARRMPVFDPATAPDWSRIVLEVGFGVEAGHRFALPSIGLEMRDAALVFPDLRTARTPAQFAAAFNPPPGDVVQAGDNPRPRLRVIDPGTWAQFFQRHLLQAADETYDFLQNKWGVPDEARSFREQMGPLVKPLTLYPLCLGRLGQEDGDALSSAAVNLLSQHPEWVGDGAWANVVRKVPGRYAPGHSWAGASGAWFWPRLPLGTVYGFDVRAGEGNVLSSVPSLPELQTMHDIAPLKYSVCWSYVNALAPHHHATVEQYKQVMGPLLSYYLPAIWGEAWLVQRDPAQYGAALNQAAALSPAYYLTLGKYYVDHRMEPEAARAYQDAIDHGADAVAVSASCGWLVDYYYDHGQQDRALTIARLAAEVYSFNGLETMAHLLEQMDRVPEAETYYKKISDRYNKSAPLDSFYARQAATHPEYAPKKRGAESEVFPQGMQAVTLEQLLGKPADGVRVEGENDLSRQAGLKAGAIVVSIDGKRIHNMEQYKYVRALSDSPELTLLVYQDERYQAIHAHLPDRKFNLDFFTWP